MNRIKGKLILITGASSGIGEACARRFAGEGASLALWARRRERLEQLAAEPHQQHGTAVRLAQVDVRDRAAVSAAAAEPTGGGDLPGVLINNPGLPSGMAQNPEGEPGGWEPMIDTKL